MRLFRMEFYKIAARPAMGVVFLLMAAFFLLVFYQEADGVRTEIDGVVYQGLEAVAKDRELAKEYEGIFTMEKAEEIVQRFGFSGYLMGKDMELLNLREGNFCSQFVTDKMTRFLQTQERPLGFTSGEFWENFGKYYVEGNVRFGYTKGWEKLQELWHVADLSLNVWLVLMAVPVFSEEYSRNTIEVLLSTGYGKSRDVRKKIEAALCFGGLAYLLLTFLLFGMAGLLYGWDGLGASAGMAGNYLLFAGSGYWSMGFYLFLLFLSGMVGALLNVGITLFISSMLSRPVTVATIGVALYFIPYGANQILFQLMLGMGVADNFLGWAMMDVMRIFCCSMPIYLGNPELFSIPLRWLVYVPGTAAAVFLLCIWRGYQNYRGYRRE